MFSLPFKESQCPLPKIGYFGKSIKTVFNVSSWQDCGKNQNVTRLVTASNNSISSFVGKLCDLELQCQGWTWRIEASIERSGCRLQETLSSPWPRANLIRYANYFFFVVLLCKANTYVQIRYVVLGMLVSRIFLG